VGQPALPGKYRLPSRKRSWARIPCSWSIRTIGSAWRRPPGP
jgi:hypothetical protein